MGHMKDVPWKDSQERKDFLAIKELREQLAAAHARIAELERCVVMGGDGKPIGVGEYKFPVTDDAPLSIRVKSIFKDEYGSVIIETDVDGYSPNPLELYSSPDSVPEGDK